MTLPLAALTVTSTEPGASLVRCIWPCSGRTGHIEYGRGSEIEDNARATHTIRKNIARENAKTICVVSDAPHVGIECSNYTIIDKENAGYIARLVQKL